MLHSLAKGVLEQRPICGVLLGDAFRRLAGEFGNAALDIALLHEALAPVYSKAGQEAAAKGSVIAVEVLHVLVDEKVAEGLFLFTKRSLEKPRV